MTTPTPPPATGAKRIPRRWTADLLPLALLPLTVTTACSGSGNPLNPGPPPPGTVAVGSAAYVENVLLAEIYAQVLEHTGTKVERKYNIGSREILYGLVQSGSLTVIPEYNGALLSYLDSAATANNTAQVAQELTAKLPATMKILDPAPAEDKNAIAVTAPTANADKLSTIEDLRPYAPRLVFGGPPEFQTRYQGLPGLQQVYGLTFAGFKALDTAGPITVSALKSNDVQVATLFTTDPNVTANHFVLLTDPKHLFGAQNVIPLAYHAGLSAADEAALNALSAKLTTPALAGMMSSVVIDKQDLDKVAHAWLVSTFPGYGG